MCAQITALNAVDDESLVAVAHRLTAGPSQWVSVLAGVAAAVAAAVSVAAPVSVEPDASAKAVAASLMSGQKKAVLLGNLAAWHPQAEELLALAQFIAQHSGASVGYFGEAGNSVGAQLVGAQPKQGGLNAGQMLDKPLKAYLLLNTEPAIDSADARRATAALSGAEMVVSFSAFRSANNDFADVLLPIAPFTETSGTFVNAEGRVQSFHGVAKPLGETRPAWKVLRVLGSMLGLDGSRGFAAETSEAVKALALGDEASLAARLDNSTTASVEVPSASTAPGYERIADLPIYSTDGIVRRAPSLQATADAQAPRAGLPSGIWQALGLESTDGEPMVYVQQGGLSVRLPAYHDASLAPNTVRVPVGHASTAGLPSMFGAIAVEKAAR